MDRRTVLAAATAAIPGLVAGCVTGEDGDAVDTRAPTSTPADGSAVTPTPLGVARREYPDYDWGQLEDAAATETGRLVAERSRWRPLVANVPTGVDIEFANESDRDHTLSIPAVEVERDLPAGETITVRLPEETVYEYVCTDHQPGMVGRLISTTGYKM